MAYCKKDHPRLRGEQTHEHNPCGRWTGSPPLARGTADRQGRPCLPAGITPACAGNSATGAEAKNAPWDHPRLRGEQYTQVSLLLRLAGSPPLARGTGFHSFFASLDMGITPACAGNSGNHVDAQAFVEDHPRLRGEQMLHAVTCAQQRGSPPLARGTVFERKKDGVVGGITPACAGNRKAVI